MTSRAINIGANQIYAHENDGSFNSIQSSAEIDQFVTGEFAGDYLKVLITPEQQTILSGGHSRFTVVVLNTSNSVDLVDVIVTSPTVPDCNKNIGNLAANSNFTPYSCTIFNVQSPFINEITVQGKNPVNDLLDSAGASAAVDLLDLEINVDPYPNSIPEPGGLISFTVNISNTGTVDIILSELTSLQFGDLTDGGNPEVSNNTCFFDQEPPLLTSNGEPISCSFLGLINGQPGENLVSITAGDGKDSYGNFLEKSGKASIQITDVPATMAISLTPDPSTIPAPIGQVNFTVSIENLSLVDSITIESLSDSVLGDLNNQGSCSIPQQLQASDSYTCEYVQIVSGKFSESKSFTLTANGIDDDLPPGLISGSDQAVVEIVQPSSFSIFLPLTLNLIEEPNNNCSQAYPLTLNTSYYFMPDDIFDLYKFDLTAAGDVTVSLTDFSPMKGQLIVYQDIGFGCENSRVLQNNADESEKKIIQLGTLESGRYYILVLNDGAPSHTKPYKLVVVFEKASVFYKNSGS